MTGSLLKDGTSSKASSRQRSPRNLLEVSSRVQHISPPIINQYYINLSIQQAYNPNQLLHFLKCAFLLLDKQPVITDGFSYKFMNKFNKKLTISLPPEEPLYSQQNQSPSLHESIQHDKDGLLQFREYRDGGDSQFGDAKNDGHNSKLNFVEFQEFNVSNYAPKTKNAEDNKKLSINKKNFVIQVPDRDQDIVDDRKFKPSRTTDHYNNSYDEDKFKQPPAPSKGSKLNKVFVFPTTPIKKQQKFKEREKEKDESESKEQLKRTFERERQEFYKEKSKLQKEILIKNGQIQMLHKLLTENLSSPNHRDRKRSQFYQGNGMGYQEMQNILLQKDVQINELLQKISQLNNILTRKSEDLSKKIIELSTSQSIIESLKNQLYIYERKDESEKLTKKFYHLQMEKPKQQADQIGLSRQFGSKGLESLYKRIEMVRMNRIQFDSRNKIKSDVSYSQTAKNRPKGAFDFKGKTFEQTTNLNKTKMY